MTSRNVVYYSQGNDEISNIMNSVGRLVSGVSFSAPVNYSNVGNVVSYNGSVTTINGVVHHRGGGSFLEEIFDETKIRSVPEMSADTDDISLGCNFTIHPGYITTDSYVCVKNNKIKAMQYEIRNGTKYVSKDCYEHEWTKKVNCDFTKFRALKISCASGAEVFQDYLLPRKISVSGASRFVIHGKQNVQKFSVSGASSVIIDSQEAPETLDIDVSGASRFKGDIVTQTQLDLEVSGASNCTLRGSNITGTASVSGVSNIDLDIGEGEKFKVSVSGMSNSRIKAPKGAVSVKLARDSNSEVDGGNCSTDVF